MKWYNRMPASILLPELGINPATVSVWYVEPGDRVLEGERVVEVLVNGATFEIVAPATGRLTEKRAFCGEPVVAGQVLGIVGES
jgi:pyruvate/2-oxoglutarate dehydrogenase complex dihydrolipoamide acyltransferase (E2) component